MPYFPSVSCPADVPLPVQTVDQYYSNPSVTVVPSASSTSFPDGTYALSNVCDGVVMTYPLFASNSTASLKSNNVQIGEARAFKVCSQELVESCGLTG